MALAVAGAPAAGAPAAGIGQPKVELIYFDIHARGELTRLCFAATGKLDKLTDTRLPLFMESQEAADAWRNVHMPRSPFGYVPYLNVTEVGGDASSVETQQVSGDGPVEMFAARYCGQGLLGTGSIVDQGIVETISARAVSILGPQLTKAGLHGDPSGEVARWVHPGGSDVGGILAGLEKYVVNVKETKRRAAEARGIESFNAKHILGGKTLSLADLAIFNSLDECMHGPRSNKQLPGVKAICEEHFPSLMQTHSAVADELASYLEQRQCRFASQQQNDM